MPTVISYAALAKKINLTTEQRKNAMTNDIIRGSIKYILDKEDSTSDDLAKRLYDDSVPLMDKYHLDQNDYNRCVVTALQSFTSARINTREVVQKYLDYLDKSTDPLRSFLKKGGR